MKYIPDSPIPYGRQNVTEEDISKVNEVLRSPLITQGTVVPNFETEICKKVKAKYGIAVNSATSALHIACISLGLNRGDWLWTTPTTFVASANCGIYCGAKVNFVDINLETGLIDVNKLEEKLEIAKKESRLPKILIPVHLCGTSCDMESISKLAEKYGFYIIEDASHAIGGRFNNEPVGNCKYSSLTVFSFHPVKIITSGEGGIITTNDKNLAEKLYELRSHGITKNSDKFIKDFHGPWSYEQHNLGYNYRMTDIHAALGLSQLRRLEEIIEIRTNIYNFYLENLQNMPINFLEIPKKVKSAFHLVVILLKTSDPEAHKNIFSFLREEGIGVQLHYEPVHLQPFYQNFGFRKGNYPSSEKYAAKAISLPVFPGLKDYQQEYIIETIRKAFQKF